jgi:hypothetical protein
VITEVITLAECNIKSYPMLPLDQAQADIEKVFGYDSDIVTGAEIVKQFRSFWKKASKKAGKAVYGASQEDPVSISGRYRVKRSVVEKLTDGVAKITPSRYQTKVKFITARGFKVAVLSKHTVSEWKTHPGIATHNLRVSIMDKDIRKTKRRVRSLHKRGFTVFVAGDLNSPGFITYHPDQINVANIGLMQLDVIPAKGIKVTPVSTVAHRKNVHTDHPLVLNHVELGRNA